MLNIYNSLQVELSQENHSTQQKNLAILPCEVTKSQQFSEILKAIINGKYSWACVLLLYWANCRPLNYIPYRTYKRLIKINK